MNSFRDITQAVGKKIDRMVLSMTDCQSLAEVETRFIEQAGSIFPADCLSWNNWARDLSHIISHRQNDDFETRFDALAEPFMQTLAYHPVAASGHFTPQQSEVMRISDFQSRRTFRENPIYREVYRHLDVFYQISHTACVLEDRRVLLIWNRHTRDFSDLECQMLRFISLRMNLLCQRIYEKEKLEKQWSILNSVIATRTQIPTLQSLSIGDLELLSHLMKGRSRNEIARFSQIRRDSLDKHFSVIRERLGLENHQQLLSALAELRAHPYRQPSLNLR